MPMPIAADDGGTPGKGNSLGSCMPDVLSAPAESGGQLVWAGVHSRESVRLWGADIEAAEAG